MAAKNLTTAWPDGVNVGQSATDKIGLYGVTPVAQRTSTVLATSLLSASSYVTVGSNTAAILLEMSNALIALGAYKTA
jgi:cell shape-determining protein MreC